MILIESSVIGASGIAFILTIGQKKGKILFY
jgi:hypothetical protein